MTKLEVLRAAYAYLQNPACWVKCRFFAYATGEPCSREQAERCCAIGAVKLFGDNDTVWPAVTELLQSLRETTHGKFLSMMEFNDASRTTHVDVLAVFQHAINRLQTEAA